jgi:tetratricopeptide (TPR) repeat protein
MATPTIDFSQYESQAPAPQGSGPQPTSQPPAIDFTKYVTQSSQEQPPTQRPEDPRAGFGIGALKGLGQTVGTVSKLLNKIPVVGETLAPKAGVQALEQATETKTPAQHLGAGAEGILEFLAGDEALKGLALADKLGLAQKVVKLAASHPSMAKLIEAGLNAVRTGTVGTAQGLAHGESTGEALTSGAVAGGTGAVLETAAEGVKALSPTVKKIAGESVPVRASQESKLADVAETAAPTKSLQKFDVEQTQPGARRAIGNVATEAKNLANSRMVAADADAALQKLRNLSTNATDVKDAATQIKAQPKPVFEKLDELTKDQEMKFSDWQKQERSAYRRGDFEAVQKAKAAQEKILDTFKDQFDPNDLQNAKDPNLPVVRTLLAWAYAMKRMYPQALAEFDKISDQDKAVAPENQFVASGLGWVYAVSGRRADALRIAKELDELSSHVYVDFYQFATIYAGLGENDEAFRLLEKGYEEHSASMPFLAVDPFWYGMRSDPRYADLLRRMGLPKPD